MLACRWSSCFTTACCRKDALFSRSHCRGTSSVWPSFSYSSATGAHHCPSLLPLLASQEGLGRTQDGIAEDNMWQRVKLLQRVHEQIMGLKAQLSETEQLLLVKVDILARGSTNERIPVITELGEIGDNSVLSILVNGLLDSNPLIASETEKALWKIFMRSGSEDVDKHLQEGLTFMLSNNLSKAKDVFSKIIEMAPSFAEGWNKRATVNYLMEEYQASIMDCKQTLELNPYHFGALSGMGLCYAALEDPKSALFCFEKAYSLHPGLGQINKLIKVLKQKLSEANNESNKENPSQDK